MFSYDKLDSHPNLRRFAPGKYVSSHEQLCEAGVISMGVANSQLNRYTNIIPFDRTLAKCSLGYVNASLIQFPEAEYIVASGPMAKYSAYYPETRPAFWTCVAENNATVMVALANFQKDSSECADYLEPGAKYGDWQVQITTKEVDENFVKRGIILRNEKLSSERHLVHFQFIDWPNYSIANPEELSKLVQSVDHMYDRLGGRILVHCSGGVGRSGTFVAAHRTYRCRPPPQDVERVVFETVVKLREDRHPWMVEGVNQYNLIFAVLKNLFLN